MVLDPIPPPLPVHFFGSRPQPPTSPWESWSFLGIWPNKWVKKVEMTWKWLGNQIWKSVGNANFRRFRKWTRVRSAGKSLSQSRGKLPLLFEATVVMSLIIWIRVQLHIRFYELLAVMYNKSTWTQSLADSQWLRLHRLFLEDSKLIHYATESESYWRR